MPLIDRTSFVAAGATETMTYASKRGEWSVSYENGTVEVTLQGKTKRLPARRYEDQSIVVNSHITGRYQQGGKAWPASINSDPTRGEYVNFGRDDRSGRFNKARGLFFAA
jgi:hypothetical protein